MKIAITTVRVPFISGGAEVLADDLKGQLERRGHEVEIVAFPFKWYPPEKIVEQMLATRLFDLTEVNGTRIDKVIALKFPAYLLDHPDKSLWLLHQHRQAYDFFGTVHSDLWTTPNGRAIAGEIKRWDDAFLAGYRNRYTIAQTVSRRLKRFNDLDSTVLYPPLFRPESFRCERFENFIFYPSRFDNVKRQHLLVDAIAETPGPLRAVLTGQCDSPYGRELISRVENDPRLRDRVTVLGRVTEAVKLELYATCAAVYNGVLDEDYGYVTIEAFFAGKPVITHTDSGGPLEFVTHEETGWVTAPNREALATCLQTLTTGTDRAREYGAAAKRYITQADLSWDRVVSTLLA